MQLLQSVSAKGVVRRQESQARVEIDAHGQVVPEIHAALLNRASQGTAEAEMNE